LNGVVLASQVRDQFVLMPFWRSLGSEGASQWFKENATHAAAVHSPFIGGGLVAALRAARRCRLQGWPAVADFAAFAVLVHAAITLAVHVPTNMHLLSAESSAPDVEFWLRRWASWHTARTVALAVGELAAIVAVIDPGKSD
jgi:hypothetical protein